MVKRAPAPIKKPTSQNKTRASFAIYKDMRVLVFLSLFISISAARALTCADLFRQRPAGVILTAKEVPAHLTAVFVKDFPDNYTSHFNSMPEIKFLITSVPMKIQDINLLTSERTYPVVTAETAVVHGRDFSKMELVVHDLLHAKDTELKVFSSLTPAFSKKFFKEFDYKKITSKLDEKEKYLFDVAYFLVTREILFDIRLAISLISKNGDVPKKMSEAFREYFNIFFDNEIRAAAKEPMNRLTYGRFMDEKDLRPLLPQSVLEEMRLYPHYQDILIRNFINESFSVFFREFYRAGTRARENMP
jgi:hypothetical protein